jgi:hypothetical protein
MTDKQAEAETACLKEEERAAGRGFNKKHHGIDYEEAPATRHLSNLSSSKTIGGWSS